MAMAAAITLAAFSLMASTEMSMKPVQSISSSNTITNSIAEQNSYAGLEYAKMRLNQGYNPSGTKSMSKGSFTVFSDPTKDLITSTGYYGNSVVAHSITSTFGGSCFQVRADQAHTVGDKIVALSLDKSNCPYPETVIVDTITVTCPSAYTYSNIIEVSLTGDATMEYSDATGIPCGGTIDISDYYMTNPGVDPFTHIRFASNITPGLEWTITACLKDGSCVDGSFIDPTPGENDSTPNYGIPNPGNIQIDAGHTMSVEVLGSQITCGAGGPEIYVKVYYNDRNVGSANWGSWTNLWGGSDVDGGETYSVNAANAKEVKFKAKAWLNGCYNQTYDSTQGAQVKTLMNGDQAPPLQGFGGQKPVQAFLEPYLDSNGIVQLPANKIILLWEMGTDMNYNPGSPAADFQDLVLLLTIN